MNRQLTLLGLDIEGEWNVPLLQNAAAMCRASLRFAHTNSPSDVPKRGSVPHLDRLIGQFDHVIACEATRHSRPVYDYPCPRGHVAVIVGNELTGIPKPVLKSVEQVISIPMYGRGMSSINVAAAAAIVLYTISRDLARKRLRRSSLAQPDIDVLVVGPRDPSELGSLLRSVWAFGWKRVFLDDCNGVWFTKDRPTVLAGRAAARREGNPLAVLPCAQLDLHDYDAIVACGDGKRGAPLSRWSPPKAGRLLLVYGESELPSPFAADEVVYVDHPAAEVEAAFRHAGSILLSVVSQLCTRR